MYSRKSSVNSTFPSLRLSVKAAQALLIPSLLLQMGSRKTVGIGSISGLMTMAVLCDDNRQWSDRNNASELLNGMGN